MQLYQGFLFFFEVPSAVPEVHGLPLVGLDTKISRPTGGEGGSVRRGRRGAGALETELERWSRSWSVGVEAGSLAKCWARCRMKMSESAMVWVMVLDRMSDEDVGVGVGVGNGVGQGVG